MTEGPDGALAFAGPEPVPTLEELLDWLATPVAEPLSAEAALEHFLLMDARTRFLKSLPAGSVVLDLGAGEGQLRSFREWLGFPRRDLRFVGVSLEHGTHTRDYEEFFVGDVEAQKPAFTLRPTAVVAGQFIEHTRDPAAIAAWLAELLPPGGLLHFDWPSPHTARLPPRAGILAAGYDVSTLNFFDDATHTRTFSIAEMARLLGAAGFVPREAGIPRLPFLADQLKHHGVVRRDRYLLTMALWLRTGFVSYLQMARPGEACALPAPERPAGAEAARSADRPAAPPPGPAAEGAAPDPGDPLPAVAARVTALARELDRTERLLQEALATRARVPAPLLPLLRALRRWRSRR